ncbi:unnamed protein product [Pedinophyceae sp. YPF-701]|nr:unnamed protein product [Pedinophyceae sp. YPF-701]
MPRSRRDSSDEDEDREAGRRGGARARRAALRQHTAVADGLHGRRAAAAYPPAELDSSRNAVFGAHSTSSGGQAVTFGTPRHSTGHGTTPLPQERAQGASFPRSFALAADGGGATARKARVSRAASSTATDLGEFCRGLLVKVYRGGTSELWHPPGAARTTLRSLLAAGHFRGNLHAALAVFYATAHLAAATLTEPVPTAARLAVTADGAVVRAEEDGAAGARQGGKAPSGARQQETHTLVPEDPSSGPAQTTHAAPDADQRCVATRSAREEERRWYRNPKAGPSPEAAEAAAVYALGVLLFDLLWHCHGGLTSAYESDMDCVQDRLPPPELLAMFPREVALVLHATLPDTTRRIGLAELLANKIVTDPLRALQDGGIRQDAEESAEGCRRLGLALELLHRERSHMKGHLEMQVRDIERDAEAVQAMMAELHIRHGGTSLMLVPSSKRRRTTGGWSDATGLGEDDEEEDIDAEAQERAERVTERLGEVEFAYQSYVGGARNLRAPPDSVDAEGDSRRSAATAAAAGNRHDGQAGASGHGGALRRGGALQLRRLAPRQTRLLGFGDGLMHFTRHRGLGVRTAVRHGDLLDLYDMVCSIALDRDEEFFAAAGVSKRIKVFDCGSVLGRVGQIQYPVVEIASRSKLASLCFNPYLKSHLACGDHEGSVMIHDVTSGREVLRLEEHEKRIWSVEFSPTDPTRLASCSDDGTVRLWSIQAERPMSTIRLGVSVCSVAYSPESCHKLAVGVANREARIYDLRNTSQPLAIMTGHKKAVSYVRFMGASRLVTASTDSTLAIWDSAPYSGTSLPPVTAEDVQGGEGMAAASMSHMSQRIPALMSYRGHQNTKNFVGLAVSPDGHIFTGSEDNAVYAYHRSMPAPMCSASMVGLEGPDNSQAAATGARGRQESFVSSLCWSEVHQVLFAANSLGFMAGLQLK